MSFRLFSCLKDIWWLRHLVLKSVAVRSQDNFANRPTCRLINPSKQQIGKISKQILEINLKLVDATGVNQWKNTSSVLQWYKSLPNKCKSAFISFDVVEFYPLITEDLLRRALDFASSYVNISPGDRQIIIYTRQAFTAFQQWNPMAEEEFQHSLCRNHGKLRWSGDMWISWLLPPVTAHENTWNWHRPLPWRRPRSDKPDPPKGREDLKKKYHWGKQENSQLPRCWLDLTTGRFKPFSKAATTPLYVHSKSNHPPSIIRNIPEAINKRLSEISCDEDAFNEAAPQYQEALRKSGYAYTLKFKPEQQRPPNQKKKRRRNIIWFKPPFNGNVKTSIGRAFTNLLDKCFPTVMFM